MYIVHIIQYADYKIYYTDIEVLMYNQLKDL